MGLERYGSGGYGDGGMPAPLPRSSEPELEAGVGRPDRSRTVAMRSGGRLHKDFGGGITATGDLHHAPDHNPTKRESVCPPLSIDLLPRTFKIRNGDVQTLAIMTENMRK